MIFKIFSKYKLAVPDEHLRSSILPDRTNDFVYSNDGSTFYTYGNEYFADIGSEMKHIYFEFVFKNGEKGQSIVDTEGCLFSSLSEIHMHEKYKRC